MEETGQGLEKDALVEIRELGQAFGFLERGVLPCQDFAVGRGCTCLGSGAESVLE